MIRVCRICISLSQSTWNLSFTLKRRTGHQSTRLDAFFFFCSWPDDYRVGLTKQILININVVNTGENAYDTKCLIQLPVGVEYVSSNSSSKVINRQGCSFRSFPNCLQINLYCNLLKQSDRIVVCHLGNPFPANTNVNSLGILMWALEFDECSLSDQVSLQLNTAVNDYSSILADPLMFSINVTR